MSQDQKQFLLSKRHCCTALSIVIFLMRSSINKKMEDI